MVFCRCVHLTSINEVDAAPQTASENQDNLLLHSVCLAVIVMGESVTISRWDKGQAC